ncbi:50S ribosomal protein L21e [Methanobrevibacter curvatus]|uniref:Large ribosomal subunit protein eL21 n=1 Tax=Methanobrevibacter curvatus TaxID=49547 RepID=A0A166DV49_9EURY|nr:50S ribosomal protein L21e [Methanobrevibacter curvatus]KZX15983.1 50S ribosomal protein L21e [Methanobrevibacter curvatus]
MQRSRGTRSKTRKKLTSVKRPGRSNPITKKLQRFQEDDLVHIIIDPSVHKGQPHPRFHGKTGKIIGAKGRAYVLGINDKNKAKELIVRPEHLKLQDPE